MKRPEAKVHELVEVRVPVKAFGLPLTADAYQCAGCCRLLPKGDGGKRCDGLRTQAMLPAKKGKRGS